jgi:hypothetical protein
MARDYILRLIEQIATMLEALISRRKAGDIIAAREDLENTSVRTVGFTLSEIKGLSPEEVAKILERSGALRVARAITLSELLLLDAQWHQEDRTDEQLMPNYVHAVCLLADSLELLSSDERAHFRARMATAAEKLGALRNHPYVRERLARYEITDPEGSTSA